MKLFIRVLSSIIVILSIGIVSAGADEIEKEGILFKTVDYASNFNDSDTNLGGVNYKFLAGVYEVTNQEYASFLNAVAKVSDPYGLYSNLMSVHFWGGIQKHKKNGNNFYLPKEGYENRPVTFISWFDAIRFINWLHYGRPNTGKSEIGTTEGTESVGAYDTSNPYNRKKRNSIAKFWLPTRNEFYKAAFYSGQDDSYWKYATGNSFPFAKLSTTEKSATIFDGGWAVPYPHLSEVGAHISSPSPFGLFDMAGNVMEWSEDSIGKNKLALGGSLFMGEPSIRKSYFDSEKPELKLSTFGFRVYSTQNPDVINAPLEQEYELDKKNVEVANKFKTYFISGIEYVLISDTQYRSYSHDKSGVVKYPYYLGKTEVSNEIWVDMLNTIGFDESIKKCMYIPAMTQGVAGGIEQVKINQTHSFRVKPGWGGRPVTYVSWYAAARFANYLHYKRKQEPLSLEGTTSRGAYDTLNFPDCNQQT
jgi:formylglycine-generating enzyme required for sulfatase activity